MADQQVAAGIHPDLRWRGMAQETERAGGTRVGAGLENPEQVADLRARKRHATSHGVQRSAERTDDVHGLFGRRVELG